MSTRKTALDALKTKFEGIDEKVLGRIAAKIAKTAKTDEEATSEVEELTLQGVIDSYTDSRVTDAQDKAIKGYEERYGLKEGRKAGQADGENHDGDGDGEGNSNQNNNGNNNTNGDGGEEPAYVKAMMQSIAALTKEITTLKAGKTADTRKSQLEGLLKDASEKTRNSYLRNFARMNFKDDADFDSWIEEITPDIEDMAETHTTQQPGMFASSQSQGRPKAGGSSSNNAVPTGVQARIDARKAVTVTPAINGLPTNK